MEKENKTTVDTKGPIIKLSRARSLTQYYNHSLHAMVAAEINIKILEKKDPKEVISQKPVQLPGMDRAVMQKITAGDELKFEKQMYEQHKNIMDVAEMLLKVEESVSESKVDEELPTKPKKK